MTCKNKLAAHLDVEGKDADQWGPICGQFWMKYFFLIGLVFVLTFGALVPDIGHKEGYLATPITASWVAVIMIFFVTGLGVKTSEMKKATLFWQINLFIHFFIYVYHPLIGFLFRSFFVSFTNLSEELLNGLVIAMCLPTTIGVSVVLTVNAKGNEAVSVVNSTLANLLGIFMTPALVFLLLGDIGEIDFGAVFLRLALRVIVPCALGQIIRVIGGDKTRDFITKIKPILKKIMETSLLYIIFAAISESFYTGLDADFIDIISMFGIVLFIHLSSLVVVWYLSGIRGPPPSEFNANKNVQIKMKQCSKEGCLRFTIYDRIAILICSAQKTAAFGIPIISSLFESSPNLGVYLLPLLLFHPSQLIIDSFLANPLSAKVTKYERENDQALGDTLDLEANRKNKEGMKAVSSASDLRAEENQSLQSIVSVDDDGNMIGRTAMMTGSVDGNN